MSTLFATTVASAKPKDRSYKMFDGGGLHLFVKPNGSKLWRLTYSWLGKQKTLSFGQWPEVTLADARDKRTEARRLIALGTDPAQQQRIDAARARIEDNDTFKAVALEWVAKNEREGMADITLSKIRWLLDKAYPRIGSRPISQITAQEVLAVLRAIEATGRYESARRSWPLKVEPERVTKPIAGMFFLLMVARTIRAMGKTVGAAPARLLTVRP